MFLDFQHFRLDILDKTRNVKILPLALENEIGKYHKILYLHRVFSVGKSYISPFTRMKYSMSRNSCYSCSSFNEGLIEGDSLPETGIGPRRVQRARVFDSASKV